MALPPLVRTAQSGSCVVHPAVRQLGPAHPSEGFVEVGQGDRAGAPGADEIAEPMRVGVFVADERRVLEPTLLASELEVPLDQRSTVNCLSRWRGSALPSPTSVTNAAKALAASVRVPWSVR